MHGNDVFSGEFSHHVILDTNIAIIAVCSRQACVSCAGAHFDVYVADYVDYRPGGQDSSTFDPPPACKDSEAQEAEGLRSFPAQLRALLPTVTYGECALGKAVDFQQLYTALPHQYVHAAHALS